MKEGTRRANKHSDAECIFLPPDSTKQKQVEVSTFSERKKKKENKNKNQQ